MILCPVCEHPQAHGSECEVCGRPIPERSAADVFVPAAEGLEPTAHPPIDTGTERLADVEPTRFAAAAFVAAAGPDVESTRAAPVNVEVSLAPDVEQTAERAPGAPTPAPAIAVCRYCRTPATPGERFCAGCGMSVPAFGSGAGGASSPAPRICGCGAAVRGSRCPSCGARE
jgi:hypothetical protein